MTLLLTCIALVAFAANSLLARAALADGAIGAEAFTAIRIVAGAAMLAALALVRHGPGVLRARPGSWISGAALLGYALAFSLAYLKLEAAAGALILFAAVHGAMIAWGIRCGDRPTGIELAGLAIAGAAFVWLLLPGLGTPDLAGSALMTLAGISWSVYSLRGRASRDPLDDTTGNFARAAVLCLPLAIVPFAGAGPGPTDASFAGIALAVVSGTLTSALGYAVWYRAQPGLSTTQGAIVQLTVPMIAAFGAVVLLDETLTTRLVVASVFILGGVALATLTKPAAT